MNLFVSLSDWAESRRFRETRTWRLSRSSLPRPGSSTPSSMTSLTSPRTSSAIYWRSRKGFLNTYSAPYHYYLLILTLWYNSWCFLKINKVHSFSLTHTQGADVMWAGFGSSVDGFVHRASYKNPQQKQDATVPCQAKMAGVCKSDLFEIGSPRKLIDVRNLHLILLTCRTTLTSDHLIQL